MFLEHWCYNSFLVLSDILLLVVLISSLLYCLLDSSMDHLNLIPIHVIAVKLLNFQILLIMVLLLEGLQELLFLTIIS